MKFHNTHVCLTITITLSDITSRFRTQILHVRTGKRSSLFHPLCIQPPPGLRPCWNCCADIALLFGVMQTIISIHTVVDAFTGAIAATCVHRYTHGLKRQYVLLKRICRLLFRINIDTFQSSCGYI